jgi:hypothetical protein
MKMKQQARRGLPLLRTALAVLLFCCVTDVGCLQRQGPRPRPDLPVRPTMPEPTTRPAVPQPPPPPTAPGTPAVTAYDVTIRPVELVAPGGVADREPPPGWSHLIIKSYPRVGAGDVSKVPEMTVPLAALFHPLMAADVQPEQRPGQTRYRFHKVGVGLATTINGHDVVVSPDTQRQLGANLGLFAGMVLKGMYEGQQHGRVIVSSEAFALVDTTGTMLLGDKHRPVITRHALLVDTQTGRLETLMWRIDLAGKNDYAGAAGPIVWLPPGKIQEAVLHVDAGEFHFGIASENALATMRLPEGQKEFPLPPTLQQIAGQPRLTPAEALQLEMALRGMLNAGR